MTPIRPGADTGHLTWSFDGSAAPESEGSIDIYQSIINEFPERGQLVAIGDNMLANRPSRQAWFTR
jgi:hypothetical protein